MCVREGALPPEKYNYMYHVDTYRQLFGREPILNADQLIVHVIKTVINIEKKYHMFHVDI